MWKMFVIGNPPHRCYYGPSKGMWAAQTSIHSPLLLLHNSDVSQIANFKLIFFVLKHISQQQHLFKREGKGDLKMIFQQLLQDFMKETSWVVHPRND